MAYLSRKGDNFVARFTYDRREYKKSLKTRDRSSAVAAIHQIELVLHRLKAGLLEMPVEADPAEFIVSGGKRSSSPNSSTTPASPTLSKAVESYRASMSSRIAPNYLSSQVTHLNHLRRYLEQKFDQPISRITAVDLNHFVEARLALRDPNTVVKERVTLVQMFKWCVQQGYLVQSPAEELAPIKAGTQQPPFRTKHEIEQDIARQGLSEAEAASEWDRLYLSTGEITDLLALIDHRSKTRQSYLLHAIPALTGMRRGEVLRLRWSDVDLSKRFLVVKSRKQSRSLQEVSRTIEMQEKLLAILTAWQSQGARGRYVICDEKSLEPLEPNVANRLFWQPMRGTEWCLDSHRNWFKLGFHTYRHSFASNLAAANVDQRIIDESSWGIRLRRCVSAIVTSSPTSDGGQSSR